MQFHPGDILKRGIYFLIPAPILADEKWKLHLTLAAGIHLFALVMAFIAPLIFDFKPRMPEVYTVNLFSATEVNTPVAPPQKTIVEPRKTKKAVAPPEKTAPPKEAAPAPVAKPTVRPAPPEAVSLRPIKTKTKKDIEKVEDIREHLLAEQRAKKAEETAEKDIKDALSQLKESLMAEKSESSVQTGEEAEEAIAAPVASGPTGGVTVDEITRRYLVAVNNQIQEHWVLPDLQNWKDSLEAIYVIKIRRDGVVMKAFFEKKSENVYFNQYVEKTVKEASPLPPFPSDLQMSEFEIGIRFRPGGIL